MHFFKSNTYSILIKIVYINLDVLIKCLFVDCGRLSPLLPPVCNVLDVGGSLLYVRGPHTSVQLTHLSIHAEESNGGMG